MTNQRQAASGEIVQAYATEEAVYLKIAVSDEYDRHMGWCKGVRVDRDTLKHYLRWIDERLNDALQMPLPWDEPTSDNVRWMPPQE